MKNIILLVTIFFVLTGLAYGTDKALLRKIGKGLSKAMESRAKIGETENLAKFISSLEPKERRGMHRLLGAIISQRNLGADSHKFFPNDFARLVAKVFPESRYDNKTMESFLRDIEEYHSLAKSLDDGLPAGATKTNVHECDKVLLSLSSKKSLTGNSGGRQLNGIKGAAPEIIETVRLKARGVEVSKIQPKINNTVSREALCSGDYKKLTGEWYLEVKNYPGVTKSSGKSKLTEQLNKHFDNSLLHGDFPGTDVSQWKGLLYRFAAAGPDAGKDTFKAWRNALRDSATENVRKILKGKGLKGKELKDEVKKFMENKFSVELVNGNP